MANIVNYERKMLSKQQSNLIDLEGTIGDAIAELQKLSDKYGAGAKLEMHTDPYGEFNREHLYVMGDMPETDKEMAERIAKEEYWKAAAEKCDREQWERLSKKFGTVA